MSSPIQNFYKATITRNWSATTGDFNVSVKPTTSSGWLVVSPNNSTLREIIYFTATGTNGFGDFVTVSNIAHRGVGGTTAQTHSIGEAVRMNITAEHWAEMQDDINSIIAAGLPSGSEGEAMIYTGGNWEAGVVDSAISENVIRIATVNLTATEIKALIATPKTILSAPGAGKVNVIDELVVYLDAGTQYASGSYIKTRYVGGSVDIMNRIPSSSITSATDTITRIASPGTTATGTVLLTEGINTAVEILTDGASEFTTGTGTLKVFIKYRILTL